MHIYMIVDLRERERERERLTFSVFHFLFQGKDVVPLTFFFLLITKIIIKKMPNLTGGVTDT